MQILFEDEHIIAVNKKAKQFVHPMPGEKASKQCLLFDVRDYNKSYVYPINRLDRPVSGIVLFAKKNYGVQAFQEIWHLDSTHKKYLCLHHGHLKKKGVFNSALVKQGVFKSDYQKDKQDSLTLYRPIEYFANENTTYTEVEIKTGRYHQIRRHFRKAVMPIIGDRKHGKGKTNRHFEQNYGLEQIFLHCHRVQFTHPITHEEIDIQSPLNQKLQETLNQIRLENNKGHK